MSSVRSGTSCGWKTDVAVKAGDQEPESLVDWLENELRESKARLHKVEGELDQALKQVWWLEASRAAISAMRRSNARSRTYLYARPGRTRPRFALTKMLVA